MDDGRPLATLLIPLFIVAIAWLRLGRPAFNVPAIGSLAVVAVTTYFRGWGGLFLAEFVGYSWFAYPQISSQVRTAWRRRDELDQPHRQVVAAIALILDGTLAAVVGDSDLSGLRRFLTWVIAAVLFVGGLALLKWAGQPRTRPAVAIRWLLRVIAGVTLLALGGEAVVAIAHLIGG